MEFKDRLKGKVALVAGATRGIACMLGEAGATVYCTGRSLRGNPSDKLACEYGFNDIDGTQPIWSY